MTMRSNELRFAQRTSGIVAGDRGDDGMGLSSQGRASQGHHADAAGLPAVPDRQSGTAARDPAGHLPADLLGSHPQARDGSQPGSLSCGGADRSGVDVRSGSPLGGQRVGADANRALDWPAAREVARHSALHDVDADQSRDERSDGNALLLTSRAAVRRHLLRACQL